MDISSIRSFSLLFGLKKAMIDMSVRQPFCFFKSIHIIVDGHKIKMPILFQHRTLISLILCSVVAPTESAQSRQWADS